MKNHSVTSVSQIIALAGANSPMLEGITQEQSEACRLADAAPELLEALQTIMRANDSPPGATMGEAKVCKAYAFMAHAAIAKATL